MNIKNLFKKSPKETKIKNKNAFKHGGYAIALTAVILAVAVGVNVLFTVLSSRVNLQIDLSLSGSNTLDEKNIEFLESIDTEVTITVCSPENDYSSTMSSVASSYYNAQDTSGSMFSQTVSLLNKYPIYSDKITLEYADPYDPSFADVISEYSTSSINIGDIIVEATVTVDGESVKRSDILNFDEIYTLYDESGYASMGYSAYTISANNLETALTSALVKVTSKETKKVTVIGAHSTPNNISSYTELLSMNNFEVAVQDSTVVTELSADTDLVIICTPYEDFLTDELNILDEWLKNGGNRGKGIIYFASVTSPRLPALEEYLAEWGIGFEDGVVFETASGNHLSGDPKSMAFIASDTDTDNDGINTIISSVNLNLSGGNVPMVSLFEEEGLRSVHTIIATSPYSVKAPKDVKSDWTPDESYEKKAFPGLLIGVEQEYVNNEPTYSYVASFSSYDFTNSEWMSTYNSELLLSTARVLSGAEDEGITFTPKKPNDNTFTEAVTEGSADAIKLIFQWGMPLLLIALGVTVFVRRRRR